MPGWLVRRVGWLLVGSPGDVDGRAVNPGESRYGLPGWNGHCTPVWYKDMGNMIAVNISTIQCGVGRVKVGDKWGILDLNYACANTTFLDDDGAVDNEDE